MMLIFRAVKNKIWYHTGNSSAKKDVLLPFVSLIDYYRYQHLRTLIYTSILWKIRVVPTSHTFTH